MENKKLIRKILISIGVFIVISNLPIDRNIKIGIISLFLAFIFFIYPLLKNRVYSEPYMEVKN